MYTPIHAPFRPTLGCLRRALYHFMVTSTAAVPSARRLQRLRRLLLARDPVCQWTECNQPETDVDHIVARRRGGGAVLDNLQGLCKY